MARDTRTYTVFLSGPADTSGDFELVKQVLDDVTLLLSFSDVRFEYFHWIEDATPGLAAEEAQQRINEQSDGYDIILAMFASRLGTPTKNYASGTVEEVSKALKRANSLTFGDNSVLIFFKQVQVDAVHGDLLAAGKVQEYRKNLPPNVLYKVFSDDNELRESLLKALSVILGQHFRGGAGTLTPPSFPQADENALATTARGSGLRTDDQDLGFLDFIRIIEENSEQIRIKLEIIGQSMGEFTEAVDIHIPQLSAAAAAQDRGRAALIIRDVATTMLNISNAIDSNIDEISILFEETITSLESTIDIQVADLEGDDLADHADLTEIARGLSGQIASALGGLQGFRLSVSTAPRATKEFNQAKRTLLQSLQRFIDALEIMQSRTDEVAGRGSLH